MSFLQGDDVRLREGPRLEQEREHVLGRRDLAGRPASPAEASLHQVQPRPGRLHPHSVTLPGAARSTMPGSPRRVVRQRHPGGLLPFRGLPQRALRGRPDHRLRLPLVERGHPGHRHVGGGEPRAGAEREHRQHDGRHRRLHVRLDHEAARRAGGLPLHQAVAGRQDASVTDWRIGADYYFFRNAGLGAQYKYNKYRYDSGAPSTQLGGKLTFQGFQVFLSFLF